MKKTIGPAVLETWLSLNAVIKDCDERDCYNLLNLELKNRRRPIFVFRIHSRLNKARAARERAELRAKLRRSA